MILHDLLRVITNLGDPVLLVPGAALLLCHLLWRGTRRAAWRWVAAFALCVVLTALSKFGVRLVGGTILDISSPSGHTGLSATFYLCSAVVLAQGMGRRARVALLTFGCLVVLAIAASRVVIRAHDIAEIVVGPSIGCGCAAWFAGNAAGEQAAPVTRAPVLAAFLALVVAANGWHVSTEGGIGQIAAGRWPSPPHVVRHGADAWLVL